MAESPRFPMSTTAEEPWHGPLEERLRSAPAALLPMLELAVGMRIGEVRHLSWELRKQLADEALEVIASHGDDVLFRGAKKGDSARAFSALATGLAVLALQEGGVSFAGRHWEARPSSIYVGVSPDA